MRIQMQAKLLSMLMLLVLPVLVAAHPLGNFTINHYSRIQVQRDRISLRYVIDMAEIPTFQELRAIDTDGDGKFSDAELKTYGDRMSAGYVNGLLLTLDGVQVPLSSVAQKVVIKNQGTGLETLRIEGDLIAESSMIGAVRRLHFEDTNYTERLGWREIVVSPADGVGVFNSSVYGNGVTSELQSYPDDQLTAPLDERTADFSISSAAIPAGSRLLTMRDGQAAAKVTRDRFTELISVPELTLGGVLLGLLVAMLLGCMHALSPGHGKTVVGAYLIGSRGTARHAAFLALTVTVTHTAGVFALGVITLLASEYVLPERLFPLLSFGSGAIVVIIGVGLLVRRLSALFEVHPHAIVLGAQASPPACVTNTDHDQQRSQTRRLRSRHVGFPYAHDGIDPATPHSHGGHVHSHLPPGADGAPITWKSLLALGVSGGLLPCPSALVVLLAAISLHRVGYGLLLVIAFSLGLAATLTGVGMAFVYAGRFVKGAGRFTTLTRVLPLLSAAVISCAGLAICYEALNQAGFNFFSLTSRLIVSDPSFVSASAFGILGLGLVYGLKHATEADHIVAVSTIVSQHKNLIRAALVGALWGLGHTASLVFVGAVVLVLKVAIPESIAGWLEFGVAIMIVGLGILALRRALRDRHGFHSHKHEHGYLIHKHIHFHEHGEEHQMSAPHSHEIVRIGFKPAIVGAIHGLAGSAALTLLVLTQIPSPLLGLLYLLVFGVGSIFGMLFMSGLVGLPFVLSSKGLGRFQYQLQLLASVLSIVFGVWYGATL